MISKLPFVLARWADAAHALYQRMRDDPFGAVLRSKRPASHLRPVQPVSIPIVTRLLAGGIAPRDHDDAAYGVMGPTGVAGLLLESNCRA
jgi:hypothetical protein